MLDLKEIRQDPEPYRRAIQLKGDDAPIDELLALDTARRDLLVEVENLRRQRNETGPEIARRKKAGEDASGVIARMKAVADRIKEIEGSLGPLEDRIQAILIRLPNPPHDSVPAGQDETANAVHRTWGEAPGFEFEPKPHWEVAPPLGFLDFDRPGRITGSGFALFTGIGARFVRALMNFFLELHTTEHGYSEVWTPFLVNRRTMTGTGQLPKFEDDLYRIDSDDLFLIPTAEVPVTNLHAGEILPHEALPRYYTAYTPCFRREAGAHGKDTRGIIRMHQFNKVELVKITDADTSWAEHEKLLQDAEKALQLLGLHYRVLTLCTGDLSFAAAKCYDLEAWAPGHGRWFEVSSCSNFLDFQARRANIRYRDAEGQVRFCHTLNASGLAFPRIIICILETYQQADGSVVVPEALRPYLGGLEVIEPGPGPLDY